MSDAPSHSPSLRSEPLHTEHWGTDDPSAPRALLVHGITSSAATMWQLGEGLAAAGWSVTAADLPGHGGTGARASYSFESMADALAALGSHWDLFVGHSLGGAVGTLLLAAHPNLATCAVLIDPALYIQRDGSDEVAESFVASLSERDPAVFVAAHPTWHPRTVELKIAANAAADPDAVRSIVLSNHWDVRDAAARVEVPVHVLVASSETYVAPGTVEGIVAAGGTTWTWETVPHSTHSVHRDQPEVVLERILAAAGTAAAD